MNKIISEQAISQKIFLIRGQRVMVDADLAELYGVSTKALNQAVKRNINRFPPDFVIQLTAKEKAEVVTNCDHLHNLRFSKWLPHAFTEYGALMLASVLNSERAVEMSLAVIRVFVKLRGMLAVNQELAVKIHKLESKTERHDDEIQAIFEAIKQLMASPTESSKRPIGFHVD